eukprot:CAMPEP_0172502740 /NCGR_PEP_ID=MMETSP1066-20121228/162477_1 /TAXON_ID=671091 /ORGANISM="Coscinodiscus wailesii, Strain CCMP2513" /LENGTH=774 /DNA_ID=CAMNT_0013278107 /DNA_START=246 /DNA_END=2567 /DNA_ORIENTATION=+
MPSKKKKSKASSSSHPKIVGPNYIRVLRGNMPQKKNDKQPSTPVAIILCGESHEDAIDVTRSRGIFSPRYSWSSTCSLSIKSDIHDAFDKDDDDGPRNKKTWKYRLLKKKDRVSLSQCKVWGQKFVEDCVEEEEHWIFLVWHGVGKKGSGYVIHLEETKEEEDALVGQEEEEKKEGSSMPQSKSNELRYACLDSLLANINEEKNDPKSSSNLPADVTIFEWRDTDEEAHKLNSFRLTSHKELCEDAHDALIDKRKANLKLNDNIVTWDEWFSSVKDENTHLLLESAVPPWEVELHQDLSVTIPEAAECVRRLGEDEDEDSLDEHDPSSDGAGSYLDYCYRQFVARDDFRKWLHSVDCRDLGCEDSRVSKRIELLWEGLAGDAGGGECRTWLAKENNPEIKLLKESVVLEEEEEEKEEADKNEITYPSFEGFFGQNTEVLYYSPHVKIAYSPFMAKCVTSLEKWKQFFTRLFFDGTIPDALSSLQIAGHDNAGQERGGFTHVRSPIHDAWDDAEQKYNRQARDDDFHISFPYFPQNAFLKAVDTLPPRTWSAQLYDQLSSSDEDVWRQYALRAKQWVLELVEKHSADPKGCTMEGSDGEYFLAYLRAVHRDIYDDIDITDPEDILSKRNVHSITSNKKYKLGDMTIPACEDAFQILLKQFDKVQPDDGQKNNHVVSEEAEVYAKIIIDIWMSLVVDFATVLKMGHIIASSSSKNHKTKEGHEQPVVLVLYMGAIHTRVIETFFVEQYGFKRKYFVGKINWEEEEVRTLDLPKSMW